MNITVTKDMVYDSVSCSTAEVDMVMYCRFCGTIYHAVPAGETIFSSGKRICDCSWNCCDASNPTGKLHKEHMVYRVANKIEIESVTTYCRSCLGLIRAKKNCEYCHGTDRVLISTHRKWVSDESIRALR